MPSIQILQKKAYHSISKYKKNKNKNKHMKMVKTSLQLMETHFKLWCLKVSQSVAELSNGNTVILNGYHSQYV